MSKTYDEWLKYYENITKEQVIFDMMLDMQEIERLNNKLELIGTIVEREFPPNEFITHKMKKILRGVDKE